MKRRVHAKKKKKGRNIEGMEKDKVVKGKVFDGMLRRDV